MYIDIDKINLSVQSHIIRTFYSEIGKYPSSMKIFITPLSWRKETNSSKF